MEVIVDSTKHLEGVVSAPSSKSYTHRMLIAASLTNGHSKIFNPLVSEDTKATLEAVKAFGAKIEMAENYWMVHGLDKLETPNHEIDCGESGSTLRFMIPVAALAPGPSTFYFGAPFERRPVSPLIESLKELGVKSIQQNDSSVILSGGGIQGGKTLIRGNLSSQFISGLLFACPKAKENTEIFVTTNLESKSYVEMTLEVLIEHGLEGNVNPELSHIWIPAPQNYKLCDHVVPGDYSSAAFLFGAAAVTSSQITVNNLRSQSSQGDKAILGILQDMGAIIQINNNSVTVAGKRLIGIDIDSKNIPDLVPICAVLACYAKGHSEIYNAKRLRYKESDRLESICIELKKMGADIKVNEDALTINGGFPLKGVTINPHNGHRIAMSCVVAALGAKGESKIQDIECINKSYPQFFNDLRELGAKLVGI
ncbi:3-phosphoshikimate 1-carboxyvinyltransferase [Candidatus Bathyarchaeota archaeon]|nr:3-phosphoshikimate 1-carboxyvinyltransferase [Candidatus Bathyarchaeota archaeon]